MRIIQISDTHLSRGKAHFADNWPPLAAWIAAQKPDLVIHTGDVTIDGADVGESEIRSRADALPRRALSRSSRQSRCRRCRELPSTSHRRAAGALAGVFRAGLVGRGCRG